MFFCWIGVDNDDEIGFGNIFNCVGVIVYVDSLE